MTPQPEVAVPPAEITWNYASAQLSWCEAPRFLEPIGNLAGGLDWYMIGIERSLHTSFAYVWDRFEQDCVQLDERSWWNRIADSARAVWEQFFRNDKDQIGIVTLSDVWTPLPESDDHRSLADVFEQRQRRACVESPPQVFSRGENWRYKPLALGTGQRVLVPKNLVEVPENQKQVPWFITSAARLALEGHNLGCLDDVYQQGLGAMTVMQYEQVKSGKFNMLLDMENCPAEWKNGILSFRGPVMRLGRLNYWRRRGVQKAMLDDLWLSFRPCDGALTRIGVSSAKFNAWVANEPTLRHALEQIR